ncbi:transcriptional regulator [Paucilactobacillus hokkaidonensis JCM 18461]|uniref:Transcriptional regulator n=2 Tax=Paucilactobacillus hokkaidonensis TaxID=1193095 RepID=A0A0A1GXZ6_9LACO|nr:transcriptional regulator [Paucilactobacillus hokkaidonensis JCM 18461]
MCLINKMAKIFLDPQIKIDKRKEETELKLFDALKVRYQSEAVFDEIKINDLCQNASISRATFYRHHQNIGDVIVVQFLIEIAKFKQQIDDLEQLDFTNASTVIVDMIYANIELFKMMKWGNVQAEIQSLFSGTALQILILRDYSKQTRNFISDFLGTTILSFAQQIAQAPDSIAKTEGLRLYRLLIPNNL